jgi:asparagine synthase (glutamine-hydrolysing)
MCGIAGQINFKKQVAESELVAMNDAQQHRGPDGFGVYINQSKTAALAHRRLSFLDLSEAGKQPMSAADGKIWITYNGEIYNYLELRSELEGMGYQFRSHTDTEVILHGYMAWGHEVLWLVGRA